MKFHREKDLLCGHLPKNTNKEKEPDENSNSEELVESPGVNGLAMSSKERKEKEDEKPKWRCILVPENKFLQLWQFIISILLCITAIYVPIKVSFTDESTPI